MMKDWNKHKATIIDLYITRNMSLKDLMLIMEQEHQHNASVRSYRNYLRDWGVTKNSRRRPPSPFGSNSSRSSDNMPRSRARANSRRLGRQLQVPQDSSTWTTDGKLNPPYGLAPPSNMVSPSGPFGHRELDASPVPLQFPQGPGSLLNHWNGADQQDTIYRVSTWNGASTSPLLLSPHSPQVPLYSRQGTSPVSTDAQRGWHISTLPQPTTPGTNTTPGQLTSPSHPWPPFDYAAQSEMSPHAPLAAPMTYQQPHSQLPSSDANAASSRRRRHPSQGGVRRQQGPHH